MNANRFFLGKDNYEISEELLANIAAITQKPFRKVAQELAAITAQIHRNAPTLGRAAVMPHSLPAPLIEAMQSIGINRLYSHQVEALSALREGKDVSIVTPTASGKTLCYNPAIIEDCLRDRNVSALYIFPLKALALDQYGKLTALNNALPQEERIKIGMMTGDTSQVERQRIFSPTYPQILIVSPDLLHFHLYKLRSRDQDNWRNYLRNLKYIIVDEAHTYIGSFGINFSNLMRRVQLAMDRLGGNVDKLQFIFSSATVGNPSEMALTFSNRQDNPDRLHLIEESGAGRAGNTIICLKPNYTPGQESARIVQSWLRNNLSGIVFCNSRSGVKSLLWRVQNELKKENHPALAQKLAVFYGSILGEKRREIIDKVKSGKISVILSTSALEAGIDLPELDCCLIMGYPGSLMSFRQRIGRAGRNKAGLIIFLPSAYSIMDNYYGMNPAQLIHGQVENAAFNPDYPTVLAKHLECGCAEAGIPADSVEKHFGKAGVHIANILLKQNKIALNERGLLIARGFPHREVNIRGQQISSITLTDSDSGETIEEISVDIAIREVYANAIYSTQSDDGEVAYYQSEELDLRNNKATLKRFAKNPELQTTPQREINVQVLSILTEQIEMDTSVDSGVIKIDLAWGKITQSVSEYLLLTKRYGRLCGNFACTHHRKEVQGYICPQCNRAAANGEIKELKGRFALPHSYQSAHRAPTLRIAINEQLKQYLDQEGNKINKELMERHGDKVPDELKFYGNTAGSFIALHGMKHMINQALPMLVLSSARDLSGLCLEISDEELADTEKLICYLYDTADGGNGAAESVYHRFIEFLEKGRALAESCNCLLGCPKCLAKTDCFTDNQGIEKHLSLLLVNAILEYCK